MTRDLARYIIACGALLALALTLGTAASARAENVDALLTRIKDATTPARPMHANFVMEIASEESQPVVWSGEYHREPGAEGRTSFHFESPRDIKGTRVSVFYDPDAGAYSRVWIPAIQRQREIRGDLRGESFLATDFNYEDLGFGWLDYREHSLAGEEKVGDQTCQKLESRASKGWWYGKIVRFVSTESGLPLRTEYYDRQGVLWKLQTVDETRTIDGRVTPMGTTMRTLPEKTRTTIRFSDVEYGVDIQDDVFTIAAPADGAS